MARVNHKKVRQLLNEKRSKITDRQFFTSRILALHFEDMAMAQTRRYKYNRRIHVELSWNPKISNAAKTNDLAIQINAGHPFVTQRRSREDRYNLICGLFAHELGHCLFTDFLSYQTYANYMAAYKWYPSPPVLTRSSDLLNEKSLWEYTKAEPDNLKMLLQLTHHIFNILEDGYVESRMLSKFPGRLGACLEIMREKQWEEFSTLTQMKEQEEGRHIAITLLDLLSSYMEFGQIKYGDEPLSDERIQVVFDLLPELDSAIIDTSSKNRLSVVNHILVRCWPYWKELMEQSKKLRDEVETSNSTGSASDTLTEMLQTLFGAISSSEGSTAPVPEATDTITAANPMQRIATYAHTASTSEIPGATEPKDIDGRSPDSRSFETVEPKSVQEHSVEEKTGEGGVSGVGKNADIPSEGSSLRICPGKQPVSETENGRIPYQKTARVSEPDGGGIERSGNYHREAYAGAASDIERMLDKMAERAACEQLENDRLRELNDVAQGISYGDIHSGVSVRINRIAEVDEELIEQYDAISGPLLTISRQLQKSLMQQLKDKQRGGKQTGLLMGRRLDAHAICHNDGKVFYKNALPNEIPEMAVGLLLDESGSMCSCDRCTYARAAAIILYDFCRSLRIPVMVYGHSTGGSDVELYSYAEFESIDQDDKYRMMDISARGSNRDGAALRFVAEQLSRRPEEVKILILVSDGQPAAPGYYGSAAEEDLRGIKQEYRRKGLLFITAAIGDDKPNIERIYGDSFLDITDLSQLPVKLASVVKRHIRV